MSDVVRGGTVPITFTYRRVTKRPEVIRSRRFVGWKRIVGTLLHRAIEWVEVLSYEIENEVTEAGREESVHWALHVDDPWGPDQQSQLIVTRAPECPVSGMNFEITRIEEPGSERLRRYPDESDHAPRPANFEEARGRMRTMLQHEERYEEPEEHHDFAEPLPPPPPPSQGPPAYAPPPQGPPIYAPDHLRDTQVSPPFSPRNGNGNSHRPGPGPGPGPV